MYVYGCNFFQGIVFNNSEENFLDIWKNTKELTMYHINSIVCKQLQGPHGALLDQYEQYVTVLRHFD